MKNLGDRHNDYLWDGDYDEQYTPIKKEELVGSIISTFLEYKGFTPWWVIIGKDAQTEIKKELEQVIENFY